MNLYNYSEKLDYIIKFKNKSTKKKLILFGTGNMAIILKDYLPLDIAYCVDNNLKRQGSMFQNLNIKSPKSLLGEEKEKIIIIVASTYYDEIKQQLLDMGFIENFNFINGSIIYKLIYENQYILNFKQIISNIFYLNDDFKRKILVTGNYNWFNLNYTELAILGALEKSKIFVIEGEPELNKEYYHYITNDYRELEFKQINLFNVSIYNICIELEISISDLDPNNNFHKVAILKWYNKSANYIEQISSYFEQYNFSKVAIMQGHFYDVAIIRQIAIKYNIDIVAFEFTFNKDRLIWDNISGITVNRNLAKNYYWKYRDIITLNEARKFTMSFIKNIKNVKRLEHQSPTRQIDKKCRTKRLLFIGQVYTDSSILFGTWRFFNPIEIISILVDYSICNDYELIIKLHPKEINGYNILGMKYNNLTFRKIENCEEMMKKIKKSNNILIDYKNEYDTYNLIENSDICITINSQAGLESLIKGKDVILCGSSSYDGLGFTYEAQNKEMLKCFLDMVLKSGISLINMNEIYKFFYIFNEYYCVNRDKGSIIRKILENNS